MRPSKGVRLLERAIDIGAEYTRWCTSADLLALAAEPLALWDEWNTVALLVDG